ncbi:MAG: glycosyltransferase family 2 protein [Flavobacteriaceae bacterium]
MTKHSKEKDISVVIPFLNEAESLPELYEQLLEVLGASSWKYELIFVDDGSRDNGWEFIKQCCQKNTDVVGIRLARNFGKSQALHAGFLQAKGNIVFTMDADLQDSPLEIPSMFERMMSDDLDILSGWKKKRYDSVLLKNIPSKIFNWAARGLSGIKLHDFNCGLKAYRSEVIKTINVHGEMHRYIPMLAKHAGFGDIEEQVVKHQARKYGTTKFGADRFVKGFLDLLTLWFIHRFGKRPMYFFGVMGSAMLLLGFAFALFLGIDKLYLDTSGRLITQRPEFYIALTTMILGSQFFLVGFLAEMILRLRHKTPHYKVAEVL